MRTTSLSPTACAAMRGLAIIGIVLHNYCHWLGPAVKENEYQFFQRNADRLCQAVSQPDGWLFVHLVSFFGHYGVPVFLFLSAYGLVRKYEQSRLSGTERAWPFLLAHFRKLFSMMFLGFALFVLTDAITPGSHHYRLADVATQLLMVNNLLDNPDRYIWPGPYWFFGLMLQFYAIYALVLRRWRATWLVVTLMVACTVVQMVCHPEGEMLNRLRYNFIGGMLPFGMGLLWARKSRDSSGKDMGQGGGDRIWVNLLFTLTGTAGAAALSLNYFGWYLVPVFAVLACVGLTGLLGRQLLEPLAWVGGISAMLFVCHPIARKIIIPISQRGDVYTGLLLYAVTATALALLLGKLRRVP